MLVHPGFNRDFVVAEEGKKDPYANTRKSIEPEHNVLELEYGHVGKNLNPKPARTISQEQKDLITSMATELAKQMVKPMLKDLLEEYTKSKKTVETDNVKSKGPSGKKGRPFKKPILKDDVEKQVEVEKVEEEVTPVPEETINQ